MSILSDPIFGDIADVSQNTVGLRPPNKFKLQSKNRAKGSSFATTVTSMDSDEEKAVTNSSRKQESLHCYCCSRAHVLEKCQQFKGKKHRDKVHFLKEKGIYFGCLCTGHISQDYNKRLICEVCDQHPTVLHIKKTKVESQQTNEPPGVKHQLSLRHVDI